MKRIVVETKDGKVHEFVERGRAGGSYTISIRYDGNFAVVEDEWGNTTIFPSENIVQIKTEPGRTW